MLSKSKLEPSHTTINTKKGRPSTGNMAPADKRSKVAEESIVVFFLCPEVLEKLHTEKKPNSYYEKNLRTP